MAIKAGTAYIDVVPDMDTFGRKLDTGVTGATKSLGSRLASFGKTAALGLGAVTVALGATFRAFEESEQVANQTEAVIKSTGSAAKVTAEEVGALATAISEKTGIDDEAIQSGENLLLTFTNIRNEAGKGNDIFNQATSTLVDLATAMGTEPKAAAVQLGKALNDPIKGITALTRVGVTFTEEQKKQIETMVESGDVMGAQKVILEELNKEFGGSAEAQATATGKMSTALGNLAETVGGLVAPAFEFLAEKAQEAIGFLTDNAGPAFEAVISWLQQLWEKIQPVAEYIGGQFVEIWNALVEVWTNDLQPALADLWEAFKPIAKVIGTIVLAIGALVLEALPPLIKIVGKVIEWLVKWETAVAKVVGAVIKWFQDMATDVVNAWNSIKSKASAIWDAIRDFVVDKVRAVKETVISIWNTIKEKVVGAWNTMKSVATTVWNGIASAIKSAINIAIDAINALIRGMNKVSGGLDWIAGPFANWGEIPQIPHVASGGIVTRPTLALVGEAGPEAIIPLSRGRGRAADGPMNIIGTLSLSPDGRAFIQGVARQEMAGQLDFLARQTRVRRA